jgi:hypothetical protein
LNKNMQGFILGAAGTLAGLRAAFATVSTISGNAAAILVAGLVGSAAWALALLRAGRNAGAETPQMGVDRSAALTLAVGSTAAEIRTPCSEAKHDLGRVQDLLSDAIGKPMTSEAFGFFDSAPGAPGVSPPLSLVKPAPVRSSGAANSMRLPRDRYAQAVARPTSSRCLPGVIPRSGCRWKRWTNSSIWRVNW